MDLKTIKKTKTELELEITGEDETILHPITHILLQNDDVEYAACFALSRYYRVHLLRADLRSCPGRAAHQREQSLDARSFFFVPEPRTVWGDAALAETVVARAGASVLLPAVPERSRLFHELSAQQDVSALFWMAVHRPRA